MLKFLLKVLKSSRFKDLYVRLLVVLCVTAFLPLAYIMLQNSVYNENIKKKNFNIQVSQEMEPSKRMIDHLLSDFESKTIQFTNSRSVINVLDKKRLTEDLPDFISLKNELNSFSDSLCCIDSISILLPDEGLTKSVAKGTMAVRPIAIEYWSMLAGSIKTEGNWQIHDRTLFPIPNDAEEEDKKLISLIRPVPAVGNEPQALVIVNLDPKALFTSAIHMIPGKELWVLSPEGKGAFESLTGTMIDENQLHTVYNPLLDSPDFAMASFHDKDYFAQLKGSERTLWNYVYLIPAEQIETSNPKQAIWLAVIVLVLVTYIVMEIRRIYRPIKKITAIFNQNKEMVAFPDGDHNEFSYLVSAVTSIMDKEIVLEGRLKTNLSIIRQKIWRDMLEGSSGDHQKRAEMLKEHGIDLFPHGFLVSVIRINDYIEFKSKYSRSDQTLRY
ncbi:hypothetical protein ABEV74_20775 [Paenibacillus cisolokensis]|uniref:hypothetical protein n=1 Tax=Paenibacillus cisolokensis TaxID=1658519 RepID=UPI003D2A0C51